MAVEECIVAATPSESADDTMSNREGSE